MSTSPTLELEHSILRDFPFVVALDEVGRGCLAGPVAVGAVLMGRDAGALPDGIRDSKLVAESKREGLAEKSAQWAAKSAIGWASAGEIDDHGIMRALGLAATRAVEAVIGDPAQTVVLLDGNHDYLSPVYPGRLSVRTVVKGDRDCGSIAAASLIAKVARDEQMREAHHQHPQYGWDSNKGYGSAAHREAIQVHGLTPLHRATWSFTALDALF